MKYKGIIALFTVLVTVAGCSLIDKLIDEYDPPTPTPIPTAIPTETPVPEPTPTPSDPMWGYVHGTARVLVENLPFEPTMDKGSIFHLYHPTTGAWMNVRHRPNNQYQPKGALNQQYGCHGEVNFHNTKTAGNGIWLVEWGEYENRETWVQVTAPNSEPCKVWLISGGSIVTGVAAFREIHPGSADQNIPWGTEATVTVLEIGGDVGVAIPCQE